MEYWLGVINGVAAMTILGVMAFGFYVWLDVFVSSKVEEAMKENADVLAESKVDE
jgi:hypothetical protein